MARIRYIKPTIGTDEDLAEVSIPARYLFAILPTLCDREGRMEDSAKVIKLSTFPWDDIDVESLLLELARHQIIRYSVGGKRFLQIIGFVKHQRPHPGEEKSKIPVPPTRKIKLNEKKLNLISNNVIMSIKGDGDGDSNGDSVAPAAPETVASKPKQKNGLQKVMCGFKEAKGIDANDADWDSKHFKRFARPAADLLKIFNGNAEAAIVYTLKKGMELDEKGMTSWGLEAVSRAAATDPLVANLTGGENEQHIEVGSSDVGRLGRYQRPASAGSLAGEALRSLEQSVGRTEGRDVDGSGMDEPLE